MRQLYNRSATRYDEASNRLFGAMLSAGGQLSDHRRGLIDLTIRRLKDQGIWDKLDCLYMFAALDSASALINWKNPGTFNATLTNSPTFTADRGIAGNGTTSFIETNFNASTAGGNFAQNSFCFGLWTTSTGQSTPSAAGWFDGTDGVTMLPRSGSDVFSGRVGSATSENFQTSITDGSGLYVLDRSASNVTNGYRNGVVGTAGSAASSALNNATFRYGSITAASFSTHQFSAGIIGGSMAAAQHSALDAILRPYMQGVGVV